MPSNVQLSTFKKWGIEKVIHYSASEDPHGKCLVTKVWCRVCARHGDKIRSDTRMRGVAKKELDTYSRGTEFVTRHSVFRHLSSKGHIIGLDYDRLLGTESDATSAGSPADTEDTAQPRKQPRIDTTLQLQAKDAYRKLLKTSYLLAASGQPLKTFKTLVNIQKANGVQLIQGVDSGDKAKEFIHELASTIRMKIADKLNDCSSFSILTDGSQARKTGSEKELVYVSLVTSDGGIRVYLAAMQNIDEYGDATAQNLKSAVDDVLKVKVPLKPETFFAKLVSATADGAAVNFGHYNGFLRKLKDDGRPWLLSLHCVNHRVELAVKDSLHKIKEFKVAEDLLINVRYMMKTSGKLKRHFEATAKALEYHVYKFPKVTGTRFINHHREALRVLLHNWVPFILSIENSLMSNPSSGINAKLHGILKKLKCAKFLMSCCVYKSVLDNLAELSLKFEKHTLLIVDVKQMLEETMSRLDDLKEIPFTFAGLTLLNGELSSTSHKPGHLKRNAENREYTTLTCRGMTSADQATIETLAKALINTAVSSVKGTLQSRFLSITSSELIQSMQWIDPALWTDPQTDLETILFVAESFKLSLESQGFDRTKIEREWKDLQIFVANSCSRPKVHGLWQRLILYRREQFKNIILLATIVLSINCSNSLVEGGFSVLTAILTDRRLSYSHSTIEDMLMIKINNAVWSAGELDDIMEDTLLRYMEKRRKLKIDKCGFSALCGETNQEEQGEEEIESDRSEADALSDDSECSVVSDDLEELSE